MSTRRLVLYEDRHWRSLRPLTDLLPVPGLAFGASDLARRWLAHARLPLFAIEARAGALAGWFGAPRTDLDGAGGEDEAVVLNAAALPGDWFAAALEARSPALSVQAEFLTWPWELMAGNAAAIERDLAAERAEVKGSVHRLACLESPERIAIAEGARVGAFAVLDAGQGPIAVRHGAVIEPHTLVRGPCVVGAGTQLMGGVVSGSTFGPECRVAGEVEASVWQGYANKRHHGFVGHSVLGEWVNLGALTATSDLKNNYGNVRVWVDGRELDTRSPKVGAFVGAHVKTGIGSLLPTGASIGVAANLFGGGRFAPKHVPPFAWWDGERMREHELERCVATARVATSRRGRALEAGAEAALRALHAATARERAAAAADPATARG